MHIIIHALWAHGLFGYRGQWKLAIFFGAMPDLVSFGVLSVVKFFSGSLNYSGPPNLESLKQLEPFPDWLFFMDNLSHSFLIAFLFIGIASKYKKELVWPMLAWPFHIILDFPFHTKDFFPTKIFWPISDFHFDGIVSSSPEVIIPNFAGLFLLFLYRFKKST
tara:strand:- start:2575 stop:3063 length:489 start_codon:yes stop_codon:yes gene_type:complete